MNRFFKENTVKITEKKETPFVNRLDVYQDGTTPMYRDTDGKLWAMSGHSHMGHIAMFCGTSLDDMEYAWPVATNFCVGHADFAFAGVRYPEGIKARGSIWPFGLYICPNTHRFFCFFHNETGWNGKGTAYDSRGLCDKPDLDSDFRHVGMMHSDDEGRNWTFDRWVLTGENVAFCEKFNPDAGAVIGQPDGCIDLGSGDFSLYVEPDGEYMYIFYNKIRVDMIARHWTACDVFVARTRKRTDGVLGDFLKYYNGTFCEPGNLGRETAIVENAWHPRVAYSEKYNKFFMTSSYMAEPGDTQIISDLMHLRVSDDMFSWSDPVTIEYEGKPFGSHYVAIVGEDKEKQPCIIPDAAFSLLTNYNGTDVVRYRANFQKA